MTDLEKALRHRDTLMLALLDAVEHRLQVALENEAHIYPLTAHIYPLTKAVQDVVKGISELKEAMEFLDLPPPEPPKEAA